MIQKDSILSRKFNEEIKKAECVGWEQHKFRYFRPDKSLVETAEDFGDGFGKLTPTLFEVLISLNENGDFVDNPLIEIFTFWLTQFIAMELEIFLEKSCNLERWTFCVEFGELRLQQMRDMMTLGEYEDCMNRVFKILGLVSHKTGGPVNITDTYEPGLFYSIGKINTYHEVINAQKVLYPVEIPESEK